MRVPESWLRAFADPALDAEALGHKLTMSGLEVEEAEPAAPAFEGVVVAHILETQPHPDADRLRVCRVDDGSGEPLQIVCGAPNAAPGLKVPLARIGATLPGGLAIRRAKMRGVASDGMLCSARELGLSEEHEGLLVLGEGEVPGRSLREALDLDEVVYTLKLTPNRADCLSILGVAREVSALTGAPLRLPAFEPVAATLGERLPVTISAPDLCGRFAGRILRGVNARARTPDWMRRRLERAGQRSISALVDISNYLMLEFGRPTHVFDLAKLGTGGLDVRWAREGESLALLNGQTITLAPDVGVIAADGRPESLAGIMGGERTSVTLDTTDIYVEAAFWWPEAIMGRARRYKFSSDASHRFERGVDFAPVVEDLERLSRLIVDICGGEAGPIDDQVAGLPERKPVRMRLARCNKVLGTSLDAAAVSGLFSSLGLAFELKDGEVFEVTPPSYRFDLAIEEDLIEEVVRLHGYEQLPDAPPRVPAKMRNAPEALRGPHALRERVAALDYQEVVNFAFVEERWEHELAGNARPIRLLNPIADPLAVLRSSLIGGLLANVAHNARHRQPRVRVFELGRVFERDAGVADGELDVAGVRQPLRLAAMAWGPADAALWASPVRPADFFDLKNDVERLLGARAVELVCEAAAHPALHPGRSARLSLAGRHLGWLGELHPRWAQQAGLTQAPVVFELDLEPLSWLGLPEPQALSRHPVVIRDLSVWVPDAVSYGAMRATLAQAIAADAALAKVRDIQLFDVWRDQGGSGEKSLGLRFFLQDAEATLDDAQVEGCLQRLLEVLTQTHGARLRT